MGSRPSSTSALSPRESELASEIAQLDKAIASRPTPSLLVHRGMARFRLAQIDGSIEDFDAAGAQGYPIPRLWQRGLSLYYAGKFLEGAEQFRVDLQVNAHDAEETLWRYLCLARVHGASSEEAIKVLKDDQQISSEDPRDYMRRIYSMYLGQQQPEELVSAFKPPSRSSFYINLYVGLLHEVRNNTDQARKHICCAVEQHSLEDYMWDLAWVHRKIKGWDSQTTL